MTPADRILLVLVICTLPFLYARVWFPDEQARYVRIQAGNEEPIAAELSPDRKLQVHGPLGDSVIEIKESRARFLASPCTGQQCVHSGWLEAAGELAACLPNRISIQLLGRHPRFDAINF
ncbi:MAG: NusG domain II-containing protein [Gammaproteobacteria bacterium]|nr:NusG domain II-containing protein [Gammaproteobacteria bacterium]